MKKFFTKKLITKFLDFFFSPLVISASVVLLIYRKIGSKKMSFSSLMLKRIGVFPILDHYYEPQFKFDKNKNIYNNRYLPGIDFKIEQQLKFLKKLKFSKELKILDLNKNSKNYKFNINNNFFTKGDAEIYYQIIRYLKPKKIIEIGSGQSTLIALEAIKKNYDNDKKTTKMICIEPYENSWLDNLKLNIIRKKVENINFGKEDSTILNSGDILFVDSSHIIRPHGDVLKIYLEILPKLKSGVIIHLHDIFSPKNYLKKWLEEDVFFWNEQYILEALLTDTNKYEVFCSVNYLKNNYYIDLKKACPYLSKLAEPGSFYIKKN